MGDLVRGEFEVGLFKVLALDAGVEAHHAGEQLRVAISGAPAGLLSFGHEAFGVVVAAGEHRLRGGPQRRVPLKGREAQLLPELGMAGRLLVPCGHVAELEQVRDAPVARLELCVSVSGLVSGRGHLVANCEAFVDAIRTPQRHMSRAERRCQRHRVA